MKVHLIRRETIEEYVRRKGLEKSSFEDWLFKIRYANWEIPSDIKATFPTADLLGKSSSRVIFNVGGNSHRLICKYAFGDNQVHVFICWVGTHAEYDELCASNKQYFVSIY